MNTQELIQTIVTVAIIPILTVLTQFAVQFFKVKTAEIAEKTKNERLKDALLIAEGAVSSAVTATMQTYVDALKKEDAFTAEAQKEAFRRSKDTALGVMGEKTLAALKDELSSKEFEIWIDTKIEQFVKLQKG